MADQPRYKRILLKVSGESFCSLGGFGVEPQALEQLADHVLPIIGMGVQVGLVVGAGNFIRGRDLARRDGCSGGSVIGRVTADSMGMLATVINALALQDVLEARGAATCVQSAIGVQGICEPFSPRRAVRHLEKGRVVIFAAGTGNPFVTTDTAAAMRARQIDAEILLKATKVDGVFDADPLENPKASKYDRLTYQQVLAMKLGVMDLTAVSMCMENKMPILVFQLALRNNLRNAVCGRNVGTLICE